MCYCPIDSIQRVSNNRINPSKCSITHVAALFLLSTDGRSKHDDAPDNHDIAIRGESYQSTN